MSQNSRIRNEYLDWTTAGPTSHIMSVYTNYQQKQNGMSWSTNRMSWITNRMSWITNRNRMECH